MKTIVITGASGGLGSAIAVEYAKINCRLFLMGRNIVKLRLLKQRCLKLKLNQVMINYRNLSKVNIIAVDVRNQKSMNQIIEKIALKYGIDTIIASAGVSAGTLNKIESTFKAQIIFETNVNGVLNSILPALPFMTSKKSGNIVIISSMAELIPLTNAPAYSSSKKVISFYGAALRANLKQYNIFVSIVIPGFITTSMTNANNFPMPFKIDPTNAAQKIIYGINRNANYIVFPKIIYYFLKIINFLPAIILDYIICKLLGKSLI